MCIRDSHPDSGIRFGIGVADLSRSVAASVIHQQQFKMRVVLRQDAIHTPFQIFFRVIDGDYNTYQLFHLSLIHI